MILLSGLRFAYPCGPAFDFPDVEVPQGGSLLVRGPSGSGKSTLLALLAGLLSSAQGRVCVGGAEINALPARRRDAWRGQTLGFMPQRLHLSDSLTVAGNIELPFTCAAVATDRFAVQAVLSRLGLTELAHRKPHELSLGQAQRVALARALVRKPRVVIADEPTANLDDTNAAAALALLRELCTESNSTLVVATHDTRVASKLPEAATVELEASP